MQYCWDLVICHGIFPHLSPSSSYTHIGLILCFISLVMRQIQSCGETDGDSFKENIGDSKLEEETASVCEAHDCPF